MGDHHNKKVEEAGSGLLATTTAKRKVKVFHQFICPITQEIMRDPVIAEDGHTYEKEAIENWLEKSPTSPMTRQPISPTKLFPNLALKQLIDQWKEEQRKSKGKAKANDADASSLPTDKNGHFLSARVADGGEVEDENETWRLVDEEELQAALERSVEDSNLLSARRQQQAKAKEAAVAGRGRAAESENAESSEDSWGTSGWIAFAGAVAVVAGGVAWAASSASSSSSSAADVKRKVRVDEENTCVIS